MKLLFLLAALTLTSTALAATTTVDRFIQRYHGLTSVSCGFRDAHGLSGTVQARKGGSYRVELPDRTIVCNGSVVWSATPTSKTVIVNAYRAQAMDLSIERVFFTLMNVYRPTLVKDYDASKTATIRLTPPAENAMVGSVKSVDVVVDASMNVVRIVVQEDAATTTWSVSKLRLNAAIPSSAFTYSVPKGWNQVDLR